MNTLYLIRHGENLANITKEFSCRKVDYPLTEKGRLQSELTARYFCAVPLDAVISSPLLRARQTAEPIARAHGLPVTVVEDFREVNVGTLEDSPPDEAAWNIYHAVSRDWAAGVRDTAFPGGENWHSLHARMRRGLESVFAGRSGYRAAVIAHAGIISQTIGELCRHTFDESIIVTKENMNCSVTECRAGFDARGFYCELVRWADHSHLEGFAAELVSSFPKR